MAKKKGKGKAKAAAVVVDKNQCADYTDPACRVNPPPNCATSLACRPNSFPGKLSLPTAMAMLGTECGSYDSICRLLRAGFRFADRIFIMTPWGNYVIFRLNSTGKNVFFVFDGCTCDVNRFRFMDLNIGTAGLQYFDQMHLVINYIIESKNMRDALKNEDKSCDNVCLNFCEELKKIK